MSSTGATRSEDGPAAAAGAASAAAARPARPPMAGEPGDDDAGARQRAGGPWWWPRRRSVVLDAVLAAFSALECAAEGAAFAGRVGVPAAFFVLLGAAAGAVLVLRRRWPIAVVLVGLAVTPAKMGILLAVVGLYTLAASEVPRRITFSLAALNTVGTFIVTIMDMHGDRSRDGFVTPMAALLVTALMVSIGVTVAPLLLGLYIGARRRLVESLVERADGLERELGLLAEKAVERAERARIAERTRIAREMHDVVAHRVSLMVVHAGALQSVALKDPEKAARSAELMAGMGREALDELRTMLGVLRSTEVPASTVSSPAVPPSPAAVPRPAGGAREAVGARRPGRHARPERAAGGVAAAAAAADGPVLGDVGKLVEESRAAGMSVELSVEGDARPMGAEAERTAYRVVQEALTNVHKHAAGARALVRVAYRQHEVAVLVENGPSDGRPSAALPSGGNGLLGMRERVSALGGGFAAGTTQDGGFRVSALLPDRG